MRLILKAASAFAVAAFFTGTGPYAGPPGPRWRAVAAELAAAGAEARVTAQANSLFQSGTPHPATR